MDRTVTDRGDHRTGHGQRRRLYRRRPVAAIAFGAGRAGRHPITERAQIGSSWSRSSGVTVGHGVRGICYPLAELGELSACGTRGCISTSPPHTLQPDSTAPTCARGSVRSTRGDEMLLTDVSAQPAGHRSRTGSPPSAGESVRSPQWARSACTIGLRPGGRQCWMCGQVGRADPPATAYFYCDGCDVRWYGGTRHLRHRNLAFKQREFTWWTASKLARARYIDPSAEHTASPA